MSSNSSQLPQISLLTNFTAEFLKSQLKDEFDVCLPLGFNCWQECIRSEAFASDYQNVQAHFLLLDGGMLFPAAFTDNQCDELLERCFETIQILLEKVQHSIVFVGTLDVPHTRILPGSAVRRERLLEFKFYQKLIELKKKYRNFCIFELKENIEKLGRETFYNYKIQCLGGMPYSAAGLNAIVSAIRCYMNGYLRIRKKVLALDLDNTLWGGVVGEDGPNGIKIGNDSFGLPYMDFQQRIKEIKESGIVLTILSKNNLSDVKDVLDKHPNMILRQADFTDLCVDWNDKADNLAIVAKRLNLRPDSFVFLDDNPVERANMRNKHPEVVTPEFPDDAALLPHLIQQVYLDHFFTLNATEEDLCKTEMYHAEIQRKSLCSKSESFESYLKTLNISLKIHLLRDEELERIAELSQKTNQFNLTTIRYSLKEIIELKNRPDVFLFSGSVQDRFGSYGIVFFAVVRVESEDVASFETLLMSCRTMGRGVEFAALNEIESFLKKRNFKYVHAAYVNSGKNKPVETFWDSAGYRKSSLQPDDRVSYEQELVSLKKRKTFVNAEIE